jgi:hypothetical protein
VNPRLRLSIRCIVAALAITVGVARAARPDQVTIAPSQDNTLFEDASGSLSDGAGPSLFAGNNGQDLARRALLQFDVAGAVPAGARILSATLTIYVSNASTTTPRLFKLHRVLAAWGEGVSSTTSGSGAPATAGDATWLHTFWPDQLWGTPGGDFVATASDSLEIGGLGYYACSGSGLASDLQAWLDDPASNHGWLVKGDEVTLNTAKRFDSRENDLAAQRPSLLVQYIGPVGNGDRRVPAGISLEPCRPNPAVAWTRLSFSVARTSQARVEILDVTGRRVATLFDRVVEPGRQELAWEAEGRGPGVYLCRLTIDGVPVAATRIAVLR